VIKAPQLLADLTRLLKRLEEDLLRRIDEVAELKASLQAEWQAARDADRTAETFETWVDQVITQAGVHWLLSCVFLRFIEDNKLVDRPWLGGTPESGNLALARDRHEAYFRANPLHSDREYLLASFREAGTLPGLHTFFDESHNPVFRLGISGDAAMAVRQFWQQVDPNTGALAHDFTDPTWNTRFLGDLYQDLSEATRKRYALLQTPEFVEEFILDRTLTPAIREFGYRTASLIDPTCGSGHFLLGAFHRFVDEWQRAEPSRNRRDIAQKALDAVAGVDLNPFAVAISRFRLLVAALLASDVHKLSEAPDFRIHVVIGDSLLHGKRFGMTVTEGMFEGAEYYAGTGLAHAYASEDLADVQHILSRQYHAVVGNPPYIVVKDAALNAAYRRSYSSCHMKYSLGAPFTERFFDLALTGLGGKSAGFVGLITTNSFMKREFGSKLIEQVLPKLDLTHVVDTSGAYIPGHGTPTVILFGRHRPPVSDVVRTVMGIKGEPSTPEDPARGLVWSAIVEQIDVASSESEYVSVGDTSRTTFSKHPWSIGGGGVADLKEQIEAVDEQLRSAISSVGFAAITGEDEVFAQPFRLLKNFRLRSRPFVVGDEVRDWTIAPSAAVAFPYADEPTLPACAPDSRSGGAQHLWLRRTNLRNRLMFGKNPEQAGLNWWELSFISRDRLATPNLITFAFVSTHNHFVFDRGGKVFNRSAPVIKLPIQSNEDDHLGLIGLLNSSVGCFWMKQTFHNKGSTVDQHGARQRTDAFEDFYEFTGTGLKDFPLPRERPIETARRLDVLSHELSRNQPATVIAKESRTAHTCLVAARDCSAKLRQLMIAQQEELDWRCYRLYGLLPAGVAIDDVECDAPGEVALGERAFEIALARRVAAGTEQTTWFERHGSTPITEIPARWTADYRRVVERRIDLIHGDKTIGLIERPEYKRRWNTPTWESLEEAALRDWLLGRLESSLYWPRLDESDGDPTPQLMSTSRLADAAGRDAEFVQIAALYAGHADFDLTQLVSDLVAAESAPFLPVMRYSDTGIRKRTQWEGTWALQRREDAGEAVGKIPVPPKYQSKDFLKTEVWRLRGGLDVPRERWVSYPGCERGADTSLPLAWAGWNHLQQATALAAYYLEMKESEGWEAARLQPLLAGLLELVPWLEQWHNEVDPVYGERMGAYYKGFVSEEARSHGFTLDDLRAWKPAVTAAKRGRKKASA
jgi:hypothetical protein